MTSTVVSSLNALAVLEGVPSAYAAARDGIDAMLRDRGLRRTPPETTGESLLRGAHASAVLEGSGSSLDEVRAGSADEVAEDAVRVSTELLSWAPMLSRSPIQVLARLHTVAGARSLPDDQLGRPRDAESAARLRVVADVLSASGDLPAMLVAAVAHAEVADAAPFASHNGIVARAVERLVLVSRGVDEKSLVVPEVGHLANRGAYESNLAAYRSGGRAGVHAWLLYSRRGVRRGCRGEPAQGRLSRRFRVTRK